MMNHHLTPMYVQSDAKLKEVATGTTHFIVTLFKFLCGGQSFVGVDDLR